MTGPPPRQPPSGPRDPGDTAHTASITPSQVEYLLPQCPSFNWWGGEKSVKGESTQHFSFNYPFGRNNAAIIVVDASTGFKEGFCATRSILLVIGLLINAAVMSRCFQAQKDAGRE